MGPFKEIRNSMLSVRRKIDHIRYYSYLVNPMISRKSRVCRSFAKKAHHCYDFLEKSQWWPRGKSIDYQNKKLRDLVNHAYHNVPYYREAFRSCRIRPEDIRTSEDLARVPILTKKVIRENFPDRIVVDHDELMRDGIWTTGGSTGEPLKFYSDMRANNFAWAAFFRFFRWHGYQWGDRISIFFRPFALRDERPFLHRVLGRIKKGIVPNVKYYDGSRLNDSDLEWVVDDLVKNKTRVLRGYPSTLTRLAEYCKENDVIVRPKFITTTGETLFSWQRDRLREQFQCNVLDQYGCSEVMGVSFECGENRGFHISHEHCIVEVVDKDGNILPAGSKGMLLLTDLDNYTMPFIRYMAGDEGSMRTEPCSCGRGLALMDNIVGRECDMIIGSNGRVAHGLFFVTLMQDLSWFERFGVKDFEVIQSDKNSIVLTIVSKSIPEIADRNSFISLCMQYFGQMTIEPRFAREIPRSQAGKRRYTRYEVN